MVLLTEEMVRRARSDRAYPRSEVLSRLDRACDRHLGLTFDDILQRPKSFLVWRVTIEELAAMAAISNDQRYLDHVREIASPLGRGGWHAAGWEEQLAVPFVLASLAGCYDLHEESLAADDGLLDIIVELAEFLAEELATKGWGSPKRIAWNHTIIGYATLGAAALVLRECHPDAQRWLDTVLDRSRLFLDVGLSASGMTWEGLTYCGFVFKHLGILLRGLRNLELAAELVPCDSAVERKLRRVPVWYAHEMFPRGKCLQNYNDSLWDPHPAIQGLLATFAPYEPELTVSVWERLVGSAGLQTYGAHPRWSTLPEIMWFFPDTEQRDDPFASLDDTFFASDVGYLSARDHWADDASVFTFNSGPFIGSIHDQSDNNSFTFIAGGEPVVLDAGASNDQREESPSSSFGHNLVLIDGIGERPVAEGKGISGRIEAITTSEEAVCVVGNAADSYSHEGHNPVLQALRSAVFVRRPLPYLLIHDDIQKDERTHWYEFLVHVPAGDESSFGGIVRSAVVHGEDGRDVGVIEFLEPEAVRPAAEEFVSRHHHPYQRHRLWRFRTEAVNPQFLVLLRPLNGAFAPEEPSVQVNRNRSALVVTLSWSYGVDKITFPREGGDGGRRVWFRRPRGPNRDAQKASQSRPTRTPSLKRTFDLGIGVRAIPSRGRAAASGPGAALPRRPRQAP
jgi:Heparinase II/III-like protein